MTEPKSDVPLIYLIAGEPSGDQLGARLMAALKQETGGKIRFAGIGGERMSAEGLESLFPISEISVMGLAEVLPHIPNILRRIKQTKEHILKIKPSALVTIDAPGFSLKVSKGLKGQSIPLIHYVAPSVWAWKPKRAEKVSRYLDHLLTLLPFEPPYFEKHGLETTFVGHPVLEGEQITEADRDAICDEFSLDPSAPILTVLPGSRRGEVLRLGPLFKEAVIELRKSLPNLQCVIPTVSNVRPFIDELIEQWPTPVRVIEGVKGKHKAFKCSDVALAASGTVALELAVDHVPTVVAYKVSPVTAFFAKFLLKIKYVSLANILLNREVQPELIQKNCNVPDIVKHISSLFRDRQKREDQIKGYTEAVAKLKAENHMPSIKAAKTILSVISASNK
ncbi:lipid-A-disaccharide synthase [Kiloniella litopenaei]|uniref:Lipid-A-disaccharide synthase n=1 Tax=Kiloniella litopenaei TaxID=1549748 RepID=A0A0M2RDA7_9PROT|nr:lipid-A-disaccharide synthase [Kiloniella litopenaei]KKJ77543.1 lipid-A-disaccharide synthase [Kiloniella litopenaei]